MSNLSLLKLHRAPRLQIWRKRSNLLSYTCCQLAGALGNVKFMRCGF
jgi:hypothetical protein